ncbi:MAG: hypothetical protein QMD10_10255 [Desulfitobacteriaceae bacterium]|nr:hypothetical protein [Desulfitobacteriaceae bacterium]
MITALKERLAEIKKRRTWRKYLRRMARPEWIYWALGRTIK